MASAVPSRVLPDEGFSSWGTRFDPSCRLKLSRKTVPQRLKPIREHGFSARLKPCPSYGSSRQFSHRL